MNATAKKPSWYAKNIKPHLGASIFITIVVGGIGIYLELERRAIYDEAYKDEVETRIYETPAQFQKAVDHDNEVPSDVENFKRELRLIEQGDIQIEQQVALDSQQVSIQQNLKVIDSFYQFAKGKSISDSIKEIVKQKSRDRRTNEIINIGNAIRAIQAKQDEN